MRGTADEEFRDFVTARTAALLRYARQLAADDDAPDIREVVTDALAETRRRWRHARRGEPEEFARAAVERRIRRRRVRHQRIRRQGVLRQQIGGWRIGGQRAPPSREPADTETAPPTDTEAAPPAKTETAPPADPVTPVLARARTQRRRRLVGAAALAVVLGGAGVALGIDEQRHLPPTPPAESGLLPWEPRGDEASDPGFVREATEAWRRHRGPGQAEGPVYVLYAGRPVEGAVALLQAADAAGRHWVAQVSPDGDTWHVDRVQRLTSTTVPVLVVEHGPRPTGLEMRDPPLLPRVRVLVAPRLTGVGVSLLTRATPTTSGRTWVYRQIRADGLSAAWLQPARPGPRERAREDTREESREGAREGATVFLFSHDNGAGTVIIESGMVSAEADLLPVDPPVRLLSSPWASPSGPGEFTRQASRWYDDGLAARSALGRDRLTVQSILTPIPGSPPPRGSLVYGRSGGTAWLVTVVRLSADRTCVSAQELGEGEVPQTIVAGRCVPDRGPGRSRYGSVVVAVVLDEDVASVRYTYRAAKPGERTLRGDMLPMRPNGGGMTTALPRHPTAPTGRFTLVAYDSDGNERGRWTLPPISAGG